MTQQNFITYETGFNGLKLIHSIEYSDERGSLQEIFDANVLPNFRVQQVNFVQTKKGCLRGLHYQYPVAQAKLIKVVSGSIFDVCVDLRQHSITFGKWYSAFIETGTKMLYVPVGFAHGFYAVEDSAVIYQMNDYRFPEQERILRWNDPYLNIEWPDKEPVLSRKDKVAPGWFEVEKFE